MMKIFVITGTRKGIGKELAEHFLSLGHIVCGCSRGKASISHPHYRHFELDVSDEEKVVSMIKAIKKEFGKIDVLLNNAGIASMNHLLLTPYQTIKNIYSTNVFGTFLFLREVGKVMTQQSKKLKAPHFRIINFATIAVPLRLEGEAVYASSKSAIASLTQIASLELAEFGITVNAIGPTPVQTDLIKNVPKEKIQSLLQRQAIKRFGSLEDCLNVIDFFLDEKSDFITGQVVYLGGVHG